MERSEGNAPEESRGTPRIRIASADRAMEGVSVKLQQNGSAAPGGSVCLADASRALPSASVDRPFSRWLQWLP